MNEETNKVFLIKP